MNFKEKLNSMSWLHSFIIVSTIVVVIIFIILTSSLLFAYKYENKIYPGVRVNGYSLSGLTIEQAEKIILSNINLIYTPGFEFSYKNENRTINVFGEKPILTIGSSSMAQKAYAYGRDGSAWQNFFRRLFLIFQGFDLSIDYQLDRAKLIEELMANFKHLENPARNSDLKIEITNSDKKEYKITFTDEMPGTAFNYHEAIEELNQSIKNYKNPIINLKIKDDQPQITRQKAENLRDEIENVIKLWPITFTYGNEKLEIKWEDYLNWLKLDVNDGKIILSLDKDFVSSQLEAFNQKISQEPKNARFEMKDGKVTEFQASQKGLVIDQDATFMKIIEEVLKNKKNTIEVVIMEVLPEITTESVNNLGITELIGVGESNFAGSPINRRRNISVGSATLHGLLIKPGEEFSLIKALGKIDSAHGYYPELVIVQGKTKPEYGGGLCQVATTLFRAAVNTGLPITERSAHAYRVVYYEPAGFDATIYDPHPDLRFINDTGNYILIQTYIDGNNLRYEFWGKSDGRVVEVEKPRIFNITSPPPTKIIETTDLAPGKKVCTESAHAGADAVFKRTIKMPDGTQKEDIFRSHYKAWQAVCQVGVEKISETTVPPIPITP